MKSDNVYVPNYIKRNIIPVKMDGNVEPTEVNSAKVIDNNQYINLDVPLDHNNVFDDNGIDNHNIPEPFETSRNLPYEEEIEEEASNEYLLMYKKQFLTSGSKEKIEKDITSILLDGLDSNASVEKEDLTVFKKINISVGVYLKE